MNYSLAFNKLCPGAQWIRSGPVDNYNNFIWIDERPQPSKTDCDAVMAEIAAEQAQEQIKRERQVAYQAEADPLFFGWQRGENTEQDWLDKVADIRARYPYPS